MTLSLHFVRLAGNRPLTIIPTSGAPINLDREGDVPRGIGLYWINHKGELHERKPDEYLLHLKWPGDGVPGPFVLESRTDQKLEFPCCYVKLRGESQSRFVGNKGGDIAAISELYLGDSLHINGSFALQAIDLDIEDILDDDLTRWRFKISSFSGAKVKLIRDRSRGDARQEYYRTEENPESKLGQCDLLIMRYALTESELKNQRTTRQLKEDFKKRVDASVACCPVDSKVVISGRYPRILDLGDVPAFYRSPFIVGEFKEPVAGQTLERHVKRRVRGTTQVHGSDQSKLPILEYPEIWSILTQVHQVIEAFALGSPPSGHGALIPNNIQLQQRDNGQFHVVVFHAACQTEDWPQPGFFISPKNTGSPSREELNYLKRWTNRDRFALGSLFYYMVNGAITECKYDRLQTWIDNNIAVIRTYDFGQGVNHEDIDTFFRACWRLDDISPKLVPLLDQIRPLVDLHEVHQDRQQRLLAWAKFALKAVVIFLIAFLVAVLPWSCGKPVVPEAQRTVVAWFHPTTNPQTTPEMADPTLTSVPTPPTPTPTSATETPRPKETPPEATSVEPTVAQPVATPISSPKSSIPAVQPSLPVPGGTQSVPIPVPTSMSTPTPDWGLPVGVGCGEGVAIISPVPWESIRGDKTITGTANLDGRVSPGEGDRRLRSFLRYQIWLVRRGTDLANVDNVGLLIVDSPRKRQNSELGILSLAEADAQGYHDGEYGLLLRIVYPTGDAQVPGCVIPIRIVADTQTPQTAR